MIKKFDIKLIILECVALIFIISGIKRLYFAYNGTIFNALTEEDWKMYEALTDMYASQFLDNQSYWILAAMLIGILVIGLINWKNNFGIINSIAVLILTVGIAMTGFYTTGIVNKYLNYFCGIFAEKYGTAFLIGGLMIFFVGILILWKTISLYKTR